MIHCPCLKSKGRSRKLLTTIREHLIINARHPNFRIWRGPGNRDSSYEEWEEEFWRPVEPRLLELHAQVDTRGMIEDTFHHVNNPAILQERVRDVVMEAFTVADSVYDDYSQSRNSDHQWGTNVSGDEPTGEKKHAKMDEDPSFDPDALVEAMKGLYAGAKCMKLAATILLMNLCTVHKVSNCFLDELLTILHCHLLPEDNCLPKKYYGSRSSTMKLGLAYNVIHACAKGCVLFRGDHAGIVRCSKCNHPWYKDKARKNFMVKVLRHFPIIPRL
jgi:hypothetical protein